MELIFILLVFLICIEVYVKFKNEEKSFALMVSTALITTIIGNLILPSDMSLFDVFNNENEVVKEDAGTIENESNISALSEEQTEYDKDNGQEEQPEAYGGGWVALSLRKKEFLKRQEELRQLQLEIELEELEQEIGSLNQKLSEDIKNSNIKLN